MGGGFGGGVVGRVVADVVEGRLARGTLCFHYSLFTGNLRMEVEDLKEGRL